MTSTPKIGISELFTPFLPTTYSVPEDQDRLKVFLVDELSNFADVINDKIIGSFVDQSENFNGEKWSFIRTSTVRNGYQTIVYIPSLKNLTIDLKSDPVFPIPDIDNNFIVTQVWGSASRPPNSSTSTPGDYFSFFSEGNSKITFTMSDTTITIITTTDLTAYSGFIIIKYLRDGS